MNNQTDAAAPVFLPRHFLNDPSFSVGEFVRDYLKGVTIDYKYVEIRAVEALPPSAPAS